MSKVVQLNLLISSRESKTTFHDADNPVVPALANDTVGTYPYDVTPTFGSGTPDTLEFYLKSSSKNLLAFVQQVTGSPWEWEIASFAEIRSLVGDLLDRSPADPFVVWIAVKSITTDHVEWAEGKLTFGSS